MDVLTSTRCRGDPGVRVEPSTSLMQEYLMATGSKKMGAAYAKRDDDDDDGDEGDQDDVRRSRIRLVARRIGRPAGEEVDMAEAEGAILVFFNMILGVILLLLLGGMTMMNDE